eukprot:2205407-Pyramimonas_sp.AAC.1
MEVDGVGGSSRRVGDAAGRGVGLQNLGADAADASPTSPARFGSIHHSPRLLGPHVGGPQETVQGRRAVLAQLGPGPPREGADPQIEQPRQRVAAQVRAFIDAGDKPGAACPRALCSWWQDQGRKRYPDVVPGVR